MTKNKPEGADAAQSRRFIEAARELGCDEDEAKFDEKLKKVAKAPVRHVSKGKIRSS
jgi:hypothetical protein